jgi:hypothetical protein
MICGDRVDGSKFSPSAENENGREVEHHVPDGEDTASLSETRLLLNTTDSLLEDGRDLGGGSLSLSSVGTDLLGSTSEGAGNGGAGLRGRKNLLTSEQGHSDAI